MRSRADSGTPTRSVPFTMVAADTAMGWHVERSDPLGDRNGINRHGQAGPGHRGLPALQGPTLPPHKGNRIRIPCSALQLTCKPTRVRNHPQQAEQDTMSRIERATSYTITHPDSSDTYRADLLELADDTKFGYRLHVDESGLMTFVPLENGMTEELASLTEHLAPVLEDEHRDE
jgi:hypothetical protein